MKLENKVLKQLAVDALEDAKLYDKKTKEVHVAFQLEQLATTANRIVEIRGEPVAKKEKPKQKPAMVTGNPPVEETKPQEEPKNEEVKEEAPVVEEEAKKEEVPEVPQKRKYTKRQ